MVLTVIRRLKGCLFLIIVVTASIAVLNAEELVDPAPTNELSGEALKALLQKQERANLVLQETLKELHLSLERDRDETEATTRRSSDTLGMRLRQIEQTLTTQREREMDIMQKSNRFLLTVAGVFGSVGLCAMVFTAWFLLRAMNRLAEVAAAFPPHGNEFPQWSPSAQTLEAPPQESTRLLGAIDRLEKRIHELEHVPQGNPSVHSVHQPNGDSRDNIELMPSASGQAGDRDEKFSVIVAKGESHLNLDQSDKALVCFDEALLLRPGDAAVLLKKGSALERLRRWDEALRCYDQTIAADPSLTLAYLYKGGVYNQLEKFSEALDCYEQALRTKGPQTVEEVPT